MSLTSALVRVGKAAAKAALKELLDEQDKSIPPPTPEDARLNATRVAEDLERLERMAEAEYVRARDRRDEIRRTRPIPGTEPKH